MITPSTSKIKPEEDENFGLDTAISAKKGRNFCVSMCNPLLLVAQARQKLRSISNPKEPKHKHWKLPYTISQ
jgi:hypothetical protein